MNQITVVSIVTKLLVGWLGFKFWQEQLTFIFSITFKLALRPIQSPTQWASGYCHRDKVASV